jgi:hypothetical protein
MSLFDTRFFPEIVIGKKIPVRGPFYVEPFYFKPLAVFYDGGHIVNGPP